MRGRVVVVKHDMKGSPDAAPRSSSSRESWGTMESALGRAIVLVADVRLALEARKESSSMDAGTLTRTDSDSSTSCRSASAASSIGDDRSTLGWVPSSQPSPSDDPQESICQVLFAERTAVEMAQIVAYWKEYADATALGRAPPPPPECFFPGNSLLVDDDDDAVDNEGDGGRNHESDECDGGLNDEHLGPWIGDTGVCSTESDASSFHFTPIRYATPSSALRRRSIPTPAAQCPEVVYETHRPRQGRGATLVGLAHGQRWAAHAAAVLWMLAVVVRWWPEIGPLGRLLAQGLLRILIQVARGFLDLLLAAQKALT